jgi:hypothetical protein
MTHVRRSVLWVLLPSVLFAWTLPSSWAQQASKVEPQPVQPRPTPEQKTAEQASAPTLADFAWLEGVWRGEWGPRTAEQVWLAPKAAETLGIFRLVENDKTLVIEIFTLVEKSGGVDFFFRHFTPQLVPWEKSDPTTLHLSSLDGTRFEFENPVNGMPKRAILTRLDADTYVARSEIVPDSGETQVIEITYHRQKPAPDKTNAGSAAHRKKP